MTSDLNKLNSIIIAIEEFNNTNCKGIITNNAQTIFYEFDGVNQFLNYFEEMCSQISNVCSSMTLRNFSSKRIKKESCMENTTKKDLTKGKQTFVINIDYRQNATWQGTINWVNKNESKPFRSALELIKLIDSAVEEE